MSNRKVNAVAIQPSINARLAQEVGSYESSLISFAVSTLAMFVMVMIAGRENRNQLR